MEKQKIETTGERIDVISDEAAVVSTSKTTTITFRNGYEMTMPYALTMLIRKVHGEWKIAHYHN
jgi:ketosteroid isomerase-like protein